MPCQGHLYIKNQWYDFLGENWINWRNQWGWGSGMGAYNSPWWNYSQCQTNMVGIGRVPTFDTIHGDARKVRVYAQCNEDWGKTVTIFGIDNTGNALTYRDSAGNWQPGNLLVLQSPYAETLGYVSRIDRVVKEVTQRPVSMFAWNTTDSVLEELAIYDPGETDPSFIQYRLGLPCLRNEDGTEKFRQMTALVKLRYIPVEHDTDLIPLSMPAVKLMLAAIRSEEGNDFQTSETLIAKAIKESNLILADRNPGKQISISNNPVGNLICNPL